jgi:predicted transposase YbfD/YdcC
VFAALCQVLAQFRDYRAGPVKHPLFSLLMILVLATLAGCRGWDASADWARAHFDLLRRYLDLWHTPPSADTLRRTAQAYDLDAVLGRLGAEDAPVHLDGKRLRGATRDGQVHHVIEALCGERVIGLVEMGAGAEAPALEALVTALDLTGRLVTLDAAGTTPAVAAAIRERQGDFLLAVKANQLTLLNALQTAFDDTAGHAYRSQDAGHGRYETRCARTITDPAIVARVGAATKIKDIRCLGQIRRTRITQDGIVTTVHYHISSRRLRPRQYARCLRSHWRIEAMHHVLDGALSEDASRISTAAGIVGALRRWAYAVIAEGRGALSFRRFVEMIRANPTPLLEIYHSSRAHISV